MDEGDEDLGTDQRIRRKVGRTLFNWVVVILSLALLGGWASTGIYTLEPGESAVILRLGAYHRTVSEPGLKWLFPAPLEYASRVRVAELRRQEFGSVGADGEQGASAIQTVDSNIVNLRYVMTYQINDPFSFAFGMASPGETLHDAAQAAVREVVGQRDIDAVLSLERQAIENEARSVLEQTLQSYFDDSARQRSPFKISAFQLQVVQPPAEVQAAFDDVVAAQQDEVRVVSVARGDAREIIARAEARVVELKEDAQGYKDSLIAKATGEGQRFSALLSEYELAPEVTRRRLYLETMEQVLPMVEKLIIEPNTVNMFPLLPLPGARSLPAVSAAPPVAAEAVPPPSTQEALAPPSTAPDEGKP